MSLRLGELDLSRPRRGLVAGEELRLLEAERSGHEHARDGRHPAIELEDHSVVVVAGVGDLVFGLRQLALEVAEVLTRLKVGVGLGDGKERAQCLGQGVVGRAGFPGASPRSAIERVPW